MNLREYLDIVWRRRWLVLTTVLLGAAAVWFVGKPAEQSSATYAASINLVTNPGQLPTDILLYEHLALNTPQFANEVAAKLGDEVYPNVGTADYLAQTLVAEAIPEIGTLSVTITGQPDAQTATTVLDAYAEAAISYGLGEAQAQVDDELEALRLREQTLTAEIELLSTEIEEARDRLSADEQARNVSVDRVKEAQLASDVSQLTALRQQIGDLEGQTTSELAPIRKVGAPSVRPESVAVDPLGLTGRLVVGLGLALLLGVGMALTLHRFDARLFSRKDAESAFRLPVLAEVPKVSWRKRRNDQIFVRTSPASPASEAYRVLRSALARARSDQQMANREDHDRGGPGMVVLVSSVSAEVGKTTTVANLALASVEAGYRVLVVSGDLRDPAIHNYFSVDPAGLLGLADAARAIRSHGADHVRLSQFIVSTDAPGVDILVHGVKVRNPGETMADAVPLIAAAREAYDLIIIDTPPMLVGNDVDETMRVADLMIHVVRAGKTTIDEGQWAEETGRRRQAAVCGLVMIGSRSGLERGMRRSTGMRSRLIAMLSRGMMPQSGQEAPAEAVGAAPPSVDAPSSEPAAPTPPTAPVSPQVTGPRPAGAPIPEPVINPDPSSAGAAFRSPFASPSPTPVAPEARSPFAPVAPVAPISPFAPAPSAPPVEPMPVAESAPPVAQESAPVVKPEPPATANPALGEEGGDPSATAHKNGDDTPVPGLRFDPASGTPGASRAAAPRREPLPFDAAVTIPIDVKAIREAVAASTGGGEPVGKATTDRSSATGNGAAPSSGEKPGTEPESKRTAEAIGAGRNPIGLDYLVDEDTIEVNDWLGLVNGHPKNGSDG